MKLTHFALPLALSLFLSLVSSAARGAEDAVASSSSMTALLEMADRFEAEGNQVAAERVRALVSVAALGEMQRKLDDPIHEIDELKPVARFQDAIRLIRAADKGRTP